MIYQGGGGSLPDPTERIGENDNLKLLRCKSKRKIISETCLVK